MLNLKFARQIGSMQFVVSLTALFLLFANSAHADDFHFNKLGFIKDSANSLTLNFEIKPPDILKLLLSDRVSEPQYCATLPHILQADFDRALSAGLKKISAQASLELPGARKLTLQDITAANSERTREILRQNCALQAFPPEMRPHLAAIDIRATVRSKQAIQRAQISMPVSLYPLMVRYGADQFWLTEQITSAVLDF